MSDAEDQGQGEPTMEEILASIRRIISEDAPEQEAEGSTQEAEPEPVAAAEEPAEEAAEEPAQEPAEEPVEQPAEETPAPPVEDEPAPAPPADEDALELTQMVAEDGSVVDLNAEREAARARSDEPPPAPEEPEALTLEEPSPEDESTLLADATRTAATASLLNLANTAEQQSLGNLTEGGGRTLEMLVRETLEPHLKTWLDANLPTLVDRIVREEIQKMVKRAEYR